MLMRILVQYRNDEKDVGTGMMRRMMVQE